MARALARQSMPHYLPSALARHASEEAMCALAAVCRQLRARERKGGIFN